MNQQRRALVTGAGGFIGSHLVKYLKKRGYWVRGCDIKHSEFNDPGADEFLLLDLRDSKNCLAATRGVDEVYSLAANMGGIGYIETVHAQIMHDNVLINTNMLEASRINRVERYFYASSACIYPTYRQENVTNAGLKEGEASPADPDNDYGWEKLYTEKMCLAYAKDHNMVVRIARFHNIYGPEGTWQGGKEKAPAAICRKVAEARDGDSIDIWGDGNQSRSFCYIDDCLEGTFRLMQSDFSSPLNIGSDELVTINELTDIAQQAAGKSLARNHQLDKPQGVRGRNSDNTLIKEVLGWSPRTSLRDGIASTYRWIETQVRWSEINQVANLSRKVAQG